MLARELVAARREEVKQFLIRYFGPAWKRRLKQKLSETPRTLTSTDWSKIAVRFTVVERWAEELGFVPPEECLRLPLERNFFERWNSVEHTISAAAIVDLSPKVLALVVGFRRLSREFLLHKVHHKVEWSDVISDGLLEIQQLDTRTINPRVMFRHRNRAPEPCHFVAGPPGSPEFDGDILTHPGSLSGPGEFLKNDSCGKIIEEMERRVAEFRCDAVEDFSI
jgi:hypothetical protein